MRTDRIAHVRRRRTQALLVTAVLSLPFAAGCSLLLNFDPEGLPCTIDAECLEGYVCNSQNVCVTQGPVECEPECGALEECVAGTCRPVCEKGDEVRACAAGDQCVDGACKPMARKALGAACTRDEDCVGTDVVGTCVIPYHGVPESVQQSATARVGFCSKPCTSDNACSEGTVCIDYRGAGTTTNGLCAPKSLLPCDRDADCRASGLTCGAYAVNFPPITTLRACREPIALSGVTTVGIGAACTSVLLCENGLCLPDDGGQNARCSTPCASDSDCSAMPAELNAKCLDVTMSGIAATGHLKARVRMCVPGGAPSLLVSCSAGAERCNADAPYCVTPPGTPAPSPLCAPACGEPALTMRCPSGTSCKEVPAGGEFCL